MNLLFSDILGIPVRYRHTHGEAALIKNIIIDHNSGKIVALCSSFNCERIIATQDIISVHRKKIIVSDMHAIVSRSEVVRINQLYNEHVRVYGNAVYDEENTYLGTVIDMELNTKGMFLAAIVVAKTFLFWSYQQKIISKKQILEITREKIVVKNTLVQKKIEQNEFVEAPV